LGKTVKNVSTRKNIKIKSRKLGGVCLKKKKKKKKKRGKWGEGGGVMVKKQHWSEPGGLRN